MVTLINTQNPVKLKYPKKHNHYGFREFFTFDADKGTIVDWNEGHNLLTTEDFIIGLVEGLQEEVGDASAATMYVIGCEWGQKMLSSSRNGLRKNLIAICDRLACCFC